MRNLVEGATVNDVALAVIGGALRSYLQDAGELPTVSLRAMTPVSVRTESEKSDLGNQVSAMVVSLATDIADPVERLAAVHRSTSASKELTEAIGARSVHTFGAGPVGDGMGLINIVGSYDEQFVLSFTACREMMPDPSHYADCIKSSFAELHDSA
jgi:hypothetical protein